jgi:hypothetical protein
MSKTRHLDTAIGILSGRNTAKRCRQPGTVITLHDLGGIGVSVQVNQKEVWLAPNMPAARDDATSRKHRLEALGRTVTIQEA